MTLDQALARNAEIQADLDAGRLTVPYPDTVRAELSAMVEVFAQHGPTPEAARELVQRIHEAKPTAPPAPPARKGELPW